VSEKTILTKLIYINLRASEAVTLRVGMDEKLNGVGTKINPRQQIETSLKNIII
jgi:hypothetical protein